MGCVVSAAPRKSLPSKFTPYVARHSLAIDSPDSDGSGFSPEGRRRSPSPTLRTRGVAGTLRQSASNVGLGHPPRPSLNIRQAAETSPTIGSGGGLFDSAPSPSQDSDLLSGMGITKRRADLMRRTSSSAWSFSSESSSEGGLNTPSRKNTSTCMFVLIVCCHVIVGSF